MSKIRIKNIYYMLSYAFRALSEDKYKDIEAEEFEYTADLMAAILAKGVSSQIKRGLGRDYIIQTETLSSPKGKINISDSIKELTMMKGRLACSYDSYEKNTHMNQVLKSTILLLLNSDEVKPERKKELKKVLLFFNGVEEVYLKNVKWSDFSYTRNNSTYKMLMNICEYVVKGLLPTEEEGSKRLHRYLDDRQMHNLYEKFILEYYKRHFPEFNPAPSMVEWDVDDGYKTLLPTMRTDITLEYYGKTTIIDAKFYSRMLQYNRLFNSRTLHSNNIYQIFSYVKNKDVKHDGSVSGILLYAKTEDEKVIDEIYHMGGNTICVKTLDLNQEFAKIREVLDGIAENMQKKI
ncbi:5-methylcytosine-specific restriction enzyme subunit McrC [Lachnospiraceae bacterium XBB1006]|nr:5-methylcytosine-specific restriction enzyme subunit McrC [Lachnospiraceae bacterium XBB1006]